MVAALVLMTLGIGFALYGFHNAGAISAEAFLAAMVFVVALSAGIVLAVDAERQAHRDEGEHLGEVPPPFDLHTVWPPPREEKGGKRADRDRPKPGATRRSPAKDKR